MVPLLATFGLAVVIDNVLFQQFSADTRSLAPYIETLSYSSWGEGANIYIGKLVALLGRLSLFLSKTHLGRAIRATSEDPDTVGLIGINARKVNAMATAIAMVTVGITGMFLAMRTTVTPYSGATQLIFAFEATMIGGAGSLWGTLAGGIVLGVGQTIGAQMSSQGFLISGHVVFLIELVARVSLSGFSLGRLRTRLGRLIS